ncbi:MAG: STT3 domain-containing protein, partial [Candidatus Pacearchaeota archaeon]
MSKSEEEIIEERKRKLKELLFKKNFIFLVFALVLLILAWHIRTANVSKLRDITTGDYTLGPDLDPYLFLRYAKSIIETGKISEIDSMRYVPLGFKTATETWFLPYLIAFFHKLLNIFNPQVSVNYSAVIFPAFMFLLTVIAFFLLSGKVFEEHKYRWYIAFVASLFLILSPAFLPRTIAGIPEKESAGFFFMFLAFYFFLCSFKESKEKKAYIFGGLAGLSTVCMGLIWGGVIYIFTVIGIFEGFMWLFNKIEKKELISYGIWLATSFTLLPLLYERFSFKGLVTSISSGTSFAVFILIFIDFILFRTKIKNYALIKKLEEKFPKKIISVTFFIIVFIIGSTLIFGTKFITNFVGDILFHLTQPYADRFSFTVAENRQPYFNEWRDEFGPIIKDIPILFSLFFFGSILLFYKTLKIRQKEKIYLTLIYSYFLFSLIFSRYSPQSIMNGTSLISKAFYFSGICVFG